MRDPDYATFARGRKHEPCDAISRLLGACILEYTILAGGSNMNALATIFDDVELSYALSYDPNAPESAPQQHLGQRRPCEVM